MTSPLKPGDVVRVPFPYSDGEARHHRPALVVATIGAPKPFLLWVLMITSAANRPWQGDIAVDDLALAGLPAPSVIRSAKIATLEASRAERIGSIPDQTLSRVRAEVLVRLAPLGKPIP